MDEKGNEISQNNIIRLCGIIFPNPGYNLKPNSKITMTVQGTWTLWRHSLSSSSTQFRGDLMGRSFFALLFKDNSYGETKLTMSDSFLPFRNDTFKISNIDCHLIMPDTIQFGSVSIKNTSANKLVATDNMTFSVSCEQDPDLYINSNIFISFSTSNRYLSSQHPNRLLLRNADDMPVSVVGEWSNKDEPKQPNCDNTITDSTILFNGQKTYSVGSLLSSEQNKTFDLSIAWGLCTESNRNSYSTGYYSGQTTVNVLVK